MDEEQALDALGNLITAISETPYDFSLHVRHIELTKSSEALAGQVQAAQELMTTFYAAGEEVWLPLINAKASSVDLETPEGVTELMSVYERAEQDYLSIPILLKHVDFILNRHEHFSSLAEKPESLNNMFTIEWTRQALVEIVNKGAAHLTKGNLLWNQLCEWEMSLLEDTPQTERAPLIAHIEELILDRLRQPHSKHESTFQIYSSFTTNYKPPGDYESLLVAASKLRGNAVKALEKRDSLEAALVQSQYSLQAYASYLGAERRAKNQDLALIKIAHERAIAEAARRKFDGEDEAEAALRSFWTGYIDALRIIEAGDVYESETLRRAVRSVPGSGEVWARYIRFLERVDDSNSEDALENKELVSDVFSKALGCALIQKDVEQIVPVILARAGYEKRQIEKGKAVEDTFATLIGVLETGIEMIHQVCPSGDSRLRLERFLAELYTRLAGLPDAAIAVWQEVSKRNKSSYLVWTNYTNLLIKENRLDQARAVFKDLCMKNLDWPEAIWEAWMSFEQLYGSVQEIDECLDRVEKAHYQLTARRMKEAEKAQYQAMQFTAEQQANSAQVEDVVVESRDKQNENMNAGVMDVDTSTSMNPAGEGSGKRKAGELEPNDAKKQKIEKIVPLKRDRENCTVFVADLPVIVSEDELKSLFKDCGDVREIRITALPNATVATVEFTERDSVPAALTKDKKRIHDTEIAVHLAWRSTLYVTNFPEKTDDAAVREMFGKYGVVFDVRWPSKKFKSTRRFCYIQFTSPKAAENALELHGKELEPNLNLSVLISNPERKKERTDADANDREIYVAGLSKFTTKADLSTLFKTYGTIKEVRMALGDDGSSKGFAFVEFELEKYAIAALAANNFELKKRRIAVTLADSRNKAKRRGPTESGLGRKAETQTRSVRIRNLPPATQEGLLQQALEKYAAVKRVEVYVDRNEATVELENTAEAGKLLLRTEPLLFNGTVLSISEETVEGVKPRENPSKTGGMFIPRATGSRPRAGLGKTRKPAGGSKGPLQLEASSSKDAIGPSFSQSVKGQDDFRKMLG